MADPHATDFDRARQAREFALDALRCPCCGGAVVILTVGEPGVDDFVAGIRRLGGRINLISAEDAEEKMRTEDFHDMDRGG